jgi:hypothetical protein
MKKCTANFMSETEVSYEENQLIPTATWETLSEAEQGNFTDATEEEVTAWNETHPALQETAKEAVEA